MRSSSFDAGNFNIVIIGLNDGNACPQSCFWGDRELSITLSF